MSIWIPLQGPGGQRPKAPSVPGWQSPAYTGLAGVVRGIDVERDAMEWIGLRCDGLVVIDCDNQEAADFWLRHTGENDKHTFVRRTPRGYHFIYAKTPGSPDGPAVAVFPGIDIRAGASSQIVFYAPGYEDVHLVHPVPFNTAWLPTQRNLIDDMEDWDEIPDGRGNNTMAAFAGAFRRQGMSYETMLRCLLVINKITMKRDPMDIEAVDLIARSVSRYQPEPDIDLEVDESEGFDLDAD